MFFIYAIQYTLYIIKCLNIVNNDNVKMPTVVLFKLYTLYNSILKL